MSKSLQGEEKRKWQTQQTARSRLRNCTMCVNIPPSKILKVNVKYKYTYLKQEGLRRQSLGTSPAFFLSPDFGWCRPTLTGLMVGTEGLLFQFTLAAKRVDTNETMVCFHALENSCADWSSFLQTIVHTPTSWQ